MRIPYFLPQVEYGSESSTYWGLTLIVCLLLFMVFYFEFSFKEK